MTIINTDTCRVSRIHVSCVLCSMFTSGVTHITHQELLGASWAEFTRILKDNSAELPDSASAALFN